ncbi:MAG: outer membrane beta-barrel protein [Bryobacteraceae bacterium]
MKHIVLLMFFSSAIFAQSFFSIGVKGGVSVTNAFSDQTFHGVDTITSFYSNGNDYIIGPTAGINLPFGFGVEADALYRSLNLSVDQTVAPSPASHSASTLSSWEFPILVKYHFIPLPIVKPYVEAGPSFRWTGNQAGQLSNKGITAGIGVDVKALVIRVSPEIRFTHWGGDVSLSNVSALARSNQNQAEFLVGVTF